MNSFHARSFQENTYVKIPVLWCWIFLYLFHVVWYKSNYMVSATLSNYPSVDCEEEKNYGKKKDSIRFAKKTPKPTHSFSLSIHLLICCYSITMGNSSSKSTPPTILVTGGCGYIGSHTCTLLLQAGCRVVVVDNLVNASPVSLDRVREIVGIDAEDSSLSYYNVDVCDETALRKVFETQKEQGEPFTSCIHFAGLKVCMNFVII